MLGSSPSPGGMDSFLIISELGGGLEMETTNSKYTPHKREWNLAILHASDGYKQRNQKIQGRKLVENALWVWGQGLAWLPLATL